MWIMRLRWRFVEVDEMNCWVAVIICVIIIFWYCFLCCYFLDIVCWLFVDEVDCLVNLIWENLVFVLIFVILDSMI